MRCICSVSLLSAAFLISINVYAAGPTVSTVSCPTIEQERAFNVVGMSLPVTVPTTAANILEQAKQDAVTDCDGRLESTPCTVLLTADKHKCEAEDLCVYELTESQETPSCALSSCVMQQVFEDGGDLYVHRAWYGPDGKSVPAPVGLQKELFNLGYQQNSWLGDWTYTLRLGPRQWHVVGATVTCSAKSELRCSQRCIAEETPHLPVHEPQDPGLLDPILD